MTFQKKRRQGWSVLWRLFCCRFARWTLKTAWPSAWDTRPWPQNGRAGKRRRKGAGNPCRENGTSNLMCSKWAHEVILSGLYPCGQIVYMDTVRVTFDLDLTFCRVSPNFCNMVTLWWVTNTVTHHLEVVNSPLSSCLPHKNGKNFSDRFSIILKVDFRSRAFLNL